MAKIFQIFNDMCYWETPFASLDETVGKFPEDVKFVEAPDYVNEQWGYLEEDEEGNPIEGDARFIQPTAPDGWIYDVDLGAFIEIDKLPVILNNAKMAKQEENKARFANFLANHPLTWTDGKTYGTTLEDQSEISLNLTQYQLQVSAGVEHPILEWHAAKEACTPFSYENMLALTLAISSYVYPWFQKMNEYKEQIFAAETMEALKAIDLVYKTDKEIASGDSTTEVKDTEEETKTVESSATE